MVEYDSRSETGRIWLKMCDRPSIPEVEILKRIDADVLSPLDRRTLRADECPLAKSLVETCCIACGVDAKNVCWSGGQCWSGHKEVPGSVDVAGVTTLEASSMIGFVVSPDDSGVGLTGGIGGRKIVDTS